ncbi:SrmB Superfamily II DNA and RNA helicases [Rhabdaerophilaceae bacterium]
MARPKGLALSNFSDFPFLPSILRALEREGYTKPTPIQAQAIPHVVAGRDLLGIAQTGTGKTAAFALPIINKLSRNTRPRVGRSCRALILSPTRELASQIAESCRTYATETALKIDVVFGGVPIGRQIRSLAGGIDILVATPGRLLDLINQRALTLREVELLVLDEADQMLDLGFIHALKRIVPMLPKERQSLFFSATMPKTIATLADSFLSNPVEVAVAPVATTAERVTQGVMFVPHAAKQGLLEAILRDSALERVILFTRTKHGADRVVKGLARASVDAAAIHGNKSQAQREKALDAFRVGKLRVLVATDIAARGIDVDGITHVINFDIPHVAEIYVHRIGRTARAGAAGIAIAFCADDEKTSLRDIEKLTRSAVPKLALPDGFLVNSAIKSGQKERSEEPRQNTGRPQRPQGQRPASNRPQGGDRPQGDRPQAPRKPFGHPPGERKVFVERPISDRDGQDRSGLERMLSDRPQGDDDRQPQRRKRRRFTGERRNDGARAA